MFILPNYSAKHSSKRRGNNIQRRFIVRVLAPPFFILLILGIVIFWQLDKYVRKQSIDELRRASSSTAVKLEREFAIRQTVLKRTGEELFIIKSVYQSSKTALREARAACAAHVQQKKTFKGAPDNVCDPFLEEFAKQGASSLQAVEDGYKAEGEALLKTQNQNINDRLAAFKQFFPETLSILIIDDKQQLVSSAISDVFKESTETLVKLAADAQSKSVEGRVVTVGDVRLGVFAYPISGGSVLAAYDLISDSFVRETWESTPIDRNEALALIVDSEGNPSYPVLEFSKNVNTANMALRQQPYADVQLNNIQHIAVGSEVGESKWLVVVASPSAIVLSPLRDAQLLAVIVIGTLLVGFLWVGAFFIQRTIRSILGLVSGAMVFAGGKLDYKIELKKADKEFLSLADTMNDMAIRIAAAEKEIDEKNKEFISVATHELRTPLTAIIGNLSMVYEDMNGRLDDMVKPLIEQTFIGTNRLRDLVNDLLDVARLEGGRAEFTIVPVDVKSVASTVVDTLQVTARSNGISLIYNDANAVKILADESRLRIVLNNFVSNAIKYNRPNGSVTVSHLIRDNTLVLAVADTGLGIPDDQKAHMFQKFFRVQNEDRKNVIGTGLGMYITRQYILAMNGKVWFESVHGQGTTFYFSLPLANQAPAVQSIPQLPATSSHEVTIITPS